MNQHPHLQQVHSQPLLHSTQPRCYERGMKMVVGWEPPSWELYHPIQSQQAPGGPGFRSLLCVPGYTALASLSLSVPTRGSPSF